MTSRGAEKMNNDTIGVDVSKEPSRRPSAWADGATRRFANTKGECYKALIKWLTETPLYRRSCSNRPGPIIAPSNARWASPWRSVRQGQSASGAPLR